MRDYSDFKICYNIHEFRLKRNRWPRQEEIYNDAFAADCLCIKPYLMEQLEERIRYLIGTEYIRAVGNIFYLSTVMFTPTIGTLARRAADLEKRIAIAEKIVYTNQDFEAVTRMRFRLNEMERDLVELAKEQYAS